MIPAESASQSSSEPVWHTLSGEEVSRSLRTSLQSGLSMDDAQARSAMFGRNELRQGRRISAVAVFLRQFANAMIVILLLGVLLSAFLGHEVEAMTIAAIVLLAAILGFVQEYRAGRAMEALRKMAAPMSAVIRGGRQMRIAAAELVPGDLILLAAGDRIPADARLTEVASLSVEESALTGESLAVEKSAESLADPRLSLGDRRNIAFAGTSVRTGRGRAVVVATGMRTAFGEVAQMLDDVEEQETPLQRNLDKFGGILAKVALGIVAAITLIGFLRGQELVELLVFGVALAVAVVPEALPAVVTVSLAIGVQRMVRRHALVRRLHAVETLGCTSVICTDKTGTLTKDEMTIRQVWVAGTVYDVSGTGYDPIGEFSVGGTPVDSPPGLQEVLRGGVLASDARLIRREGVYDIHGDPTEGAFVVAAAKLGLHRDHLDSAHPRVAEIPFSSETRRMTTLHGDEESGMAYSKGAPEVILSLCTRFWGSQGELPLSGDDRRSILGTADAMASRGLRVIAVARKGRTNLAGAHSEKKFLGLVGMMDPPRPEALEAIRRCREAGIRVVMITGDHPGTAQAIARELGISGNGALLTGAALDDLDAPGLARAVQETTVFARVSPAHKLRLVEAFQLGGKVVAMTGDGVNDAPALKRADIGIAMGITGTDVTREAAVMTLTDDNFASIVAAVEEGRMIFGNIRKYLLYLLSSNAGEMMLMTVATIAGWPLPLSAVQLLYLNLATDGFPALALAVDPPSSDLMRRPPRDPKAGIFSKRAVILMLAGSTWLALSVLALFRFELGSGRSLQDSMAMAFVLIVVIEFIKAFIFRSERHSVFRRTFANRWLNLAILWEILLFLCIVYVPFFHLPFGTFALSWRDWGVVLAVAVTLIPVLEGTKWILAHRKAA